MSTDTPEPSFQVSFPSRLLSENTHICRRQLITDQQGDKIALLTASTPFHPLDFTWPDQPADKGTIACGSSTFPVESSLTGAINTETNELFIGESTPARKGEPGWQFMVVHLTPHTEEAEQLLQPGATVELTIDGTYQNQLSLGHTACHLSALALNRELSREPNGYWRKDPGRKDALGNTDFDQLCITASKIEPNGSHDHYRLGKSIRKKGLNTTEVMDSLEQLMPRIESQINSWLALETDIRMECEGDTLTDRRYWHCDLKHDGQVVIPCGGTHARNLGELGSVQISAERISPQEFVMVTKVIPLTSE